MDQFTAVYNRLNIAQKQAVDAIDGPVLVVAGPGTGKTQLLSARVANILRKTDAAPENILCLTFTEAGAENMRQRLSGMIGKDAYGVTISTYHAFGSELMRRHRDYFTDQADLEAIDDLGIDTTLRAILGDLPFSNPLKNAHTYLRDVRSTLSELKRALLEPADVLAICDQNDAFVTFANEQVGQELQTFTKMVKSAVPTFESLASATTQYQAAPIANIQSLATDWQRSLETALAQVADTGKTTALTAWKNKWLAKNTAGNLIAGQYMQSQRLRSVGEIYQKYNKALVAQSQYDYDDMILRAIKGLETNPDLRYTLQEKYLYLLLDEFQDTNAAQLRLVQLLTDSPVHENRPNVLAVGDDDQAIYAFQGADYSHMLAFYTGYRDVLVVPLTENYRSSPEILRTAEAISGQVSERLQRHLPAINKTLQARNTTLPPAVIERHEFKSDSSQYAWVAQQIKRLTEQGIAAEEIAVLAPQHRFLEPLVPHLQQAGLGVYYEKSENILDDPIVLQLTHMSQLVQALAESRYDVAASFWPEVLSYKFWQLPTSLIWQLSWQANDDHHDWTDTMLQTEQTKPIALLFIRLSQLLQTESLEMMLDHLIGVTPVPLNEIDLDQVSSPLYSFYFGDVSATATTSSDFWNLLNSLTVLRAHLRSYAPDDKPLQLTDLLGFVEAHRQANIKILNTSPYRDSDNAVQLMTAYKSKGQEFVAVFVLACQEDVWGDSARSQSSNVTLPANLQFMRYAGADHDERLRLFFVALTRARTHLYLTNYTTSLTGRLTSRLSFLAERSVDGTVVSPYLPETSQVVRQNDNQAPSITTLRTDWQRRHSDPERLELRSLLEPRLRNYQLSPTHLNSFIDLEYGGPQRFFMNTILRFPKASTPEGQYGNAYHETLEWLNNQFVQTGTVATEQALLKRFERQLKAKRLSDDLFTQFIERANPALQAYLSQRQHVLSKDVISEYNFRSEAVFLEDAQLGGKIDKLIINQSDRTVTIVDYKTGRAFTRWLPSTKLHKYKQQLYLYKVLVEGSQRFKGYTVTDAYLEFVEPDETGTIQELHVAFDADEAAEISLLAHLVWQRIKNLQLPDVSRYSPDLKGTLAFEDDIRNDSI